MNIGIITLWESNNYGGVLQAYAMQTFLEQLGHRAFIVPVQYGRKKKILKTLERPVKFAVDVIKARKFALFRTRYLKTSGLVPCEVQKVLDEGVTAEALITGSDQVWNPGNCSKTELRRLFFLDFGSPTVKRIAYAASWGAKTLNPAVKPDVAACLNLLQAVSVREKSGIKIAEELGCAAAWLPDPTLLLETAVWEELADTAIRSSRPNTLFQCEYRWTPCIEFSPVVRTLTTRLQLRPVIPFSNHVIRDVAYTQCLTPPEWVNGIRRASFVLTNSFHGMVFSIIFRRPFIVIPLIGKYAGMNERLFSLAERLGLENRFLTESDTTRIASLADTPIDWEEVGKRLSAWREEAREFLTTSLN